MGEEEPESSSSIFNVTLEVPPLLPNYGRHVSGISSKLKKNRGSAKKECMVKAMGHLEFSFNALETIGRKKMTYYVLFESSLIQIITELRNLKH